MNWPRRPLLASSQGHIVHMWQEQMPPSLCTWIRASAGGRTLGILVSLLISSGNIVYRALHPGAWELNGAKERPLSLLRSRVLWVERGQKGGSNPELHDKRGTSCDTSERVSCFSTWTTTYLYWNCLNEVSPPSKLDLGPMLGKVSVWQSVLE